MKYATSLTVSAFLLVLASHAQAATFDFWAVGFEGGGVLRGTFSGQDLDGNGRIQSFDFMGGRGGEVSELSFSFTGDNLVGDFSGDLALTDISYRIGDGLLGDDLDEGFSFNFANAQPDGPPELELVPSLSGPCDGASICGFTYEVETNPLGGFISKFSNFSGFGLVVVPRAAQVPPIAVIPLPASGLLLLAAFGMTLIYGRRSA